MKGISAVVATYNRKDELVRLFKSFVANNFNSLEVIIVDQNNNCLIDDLIETYKPWLTIKHLKLDVQNQSKARNIGAMQAKHEIICFPDDDCWYDDDTLRKISDFFLTNKNSDVLIMNWQQNQRPGGLISQKVSKGMIYSFKAPFHYGTIVQVFRKEKFYKLGGFIETIGIGMYIGAGEDSELLFRAAKKEMNIYYNATIYVNHAYTGKLNRDPHSIRIRERATGYIYSKYSVFSYTLLRGLCSPLFNMVISFNNKNRKQHFFNFLGRVEGMIYGFRRSTHHSYSLDRNSKDQFYQS